MAEPFIIAENLSYTYQDGEGGGTAALRGVSFRIDRGEYVAVLGHNGSGKSTLAKLMNGILIPTGGKLTVCGTEMKEGMRDDEIFGVRRRVGMVFQNPDNQLVATIVEEDVAFGPRTSACRARRSAAAWTTRSTRSGCMNTRTASRTASRADRSSASPSPASSP